MIDGLGNPQSVMVVGGSSEIGLSTVKRLARSKRLRRVVLVGRNLGGAIDEVFALSGGVVVESVDVDLTAVDQLETLVRDVWREGVDVVILTAGYLPRPEESPLDVEVGTYCVTVNFVSQLVVGATALDLMMKQGAGTLVVLSSVAVERPRKENLVYGASKVGLDAWARGMADVLRDLPIRVLVVRPGMVRTRMSSHLDEAPMTVSKEDVADEIVQNLVRGPTVVWVPHRLRWVFIVLRHLPQWAFRRLGSRGWKGRDTPIT